MDDRLIALFERLSEDMANLAKAVARSQDALDKLLHEVRKNGKTQEKRLDTIQATQRFLANQQPRWETTRNGMVRVVQGAYRRPLENDDSD